MILKALTTSMNLMSFTTLTTLSDLLTLTTLLNLRDNGEFNDFDDSDDFHFIYLFLFQILLLKIFHGIYSSPKRTSVLYVECRYLILTILNSLRTGLETANLTIDKLRKELLEAKNQPLMVKIQDEHTNADLELSQAQLTEVKATYEDAKRTISSIEDHLAEVKFQLKQKVSKEEANHS